eukprot:TRINITY_DN1755_c0_g1_i1.p2 TRINITY_DN1755_c0_g1~~TRINITY_DN1755_c0_g1_i1.p2  ORF type:complete len:346 (-),score=26.54 TRINITY_DN1755_c0_g1_i1:5850-6887(-)
MASSTFSSLYPTNESWLTSEAGEKLSPFINSASGVSVMEAMSMLSNCEGLNKDGNRSYSARSTVSLLSQESREWQASVSRAPSPNSVLPDLRDSLKQEGTDKSGSGRSAVLTAQGISQISQDLHKQPVDEADLAGYLGGLLGVIQQNGWQQQQQQLSGRYCSNSTPQQINGGLNVVDNCNRPVSQQTDLMQQILTNPFGNHLYKTELCRAFDETGLCRFGDRCKYAHGFAELRPAVRCSNYKSKICKAYAVEGYCSYGSRCNFAHTPLKVPHWVQGLSPQGNKNIPNSSPSSPHQSLTGSDSTESIGSATTNNENRTATSFAESASIQRRLPVFVWLTSLGDSLM